MNLPEFAATVVLLAIAFWSFQATSAPASADISPLIVEPISIIRPVQSADGSVHLVYELLLVNQSAFSVSLDHLEVFDEQHTLLDELTAPEIAANSRLSLIAGTGAVLQPSQSSFIFLDVTIPGGAGLPNALTHRFTTIESAPDQRGSMNLGGLAVEPEMAGDGSASFEIRPLPVTQEMAVVLAAPVHGENWVALRGCCDLMSSHRGNTAIFDGEVRIAERFAVDFVRLDDAGRMITGPGNELASYVYYGEEVYAVADGVVVSARNTEETQTPGSLAGESGEHAAGGNSVVLDIGGGRFAFYAHMQPGSVRVTAGSTVNAGDVIGLLGNSGRTVGPHLHFHVTDSSSPMVSDGLPFVFESFDGQGVLTPDAFGLAMQGQPAPIIAGELPGPHPNVMPVNGQVIDFGH